LTIVLFDGFILILIIGISIWDIYATRRGPIKKIIEITDKDEAEIKKSRASRNSTTSSDHPQTPVEAKNGQTRAVLETRTTSAQRIAPTQSSTKVQPRQENVKPGPGQGQRTGPPAPQAVPIPKNAGVKNKPTKEDDIEALQLFGLYDTDNFSIGVGDLIFYSVLTAITMKYFLFKLPFYGFYTSSLGISISFFIAAIIGLAVMIGFFKTVELLEKNYILPGLPISMGIGLACFVLFLSILEVLNFLYYGYVAPIF
jgi:hypothetical protein